MQEQGYNRRRANMRNLLFVGRDGNGKKSSVDSIANVDPANRELNAVKCSGVGDSKVDRTQKIETVMNNVRSEIQRWGGFIAIVFVLKYGVRFTRQEKDAVDIVKLMFGRDVFRTNGVILMTYGDLFAMDNEDNGSRQFRNWCRDQTGDIQLLFSEVKDRIVLFDNKTKDTQEMQKQYNELLSIVSQITTIYGMTEFEKAKPGRDELIKKEYPGTNFTLDMTGRALDSKASKLKVILPACLGVLMVTGLLIWQISVWFLAPMTILIVGAVVIVKRKTNVRDMEAK
ncbi:hypothetical protein Btru_048286 [Bulinus truncatus]|nr:hypothetical protein Btru_048286 [Bulinus truncatus]